MRCEKLGLVICECENVLSHIYLLALLGFYLLFGMLK